MHSAWVRPMRRLGATALTGVTVAAVGVPAAWAAPLAAGCAPAGPTVTCTHGYTGSERSFPAVLQFDAHAYTTRAVPGATVGAADLTCRVTAGIVTTNAPGRAGASRAAGTIDLDGVRAASATAIVLKAQQITTQGIAVTATAIQPARGPIITTGTTTLNATKVNGIAVPADPAPNTTLPLPGGSLTLNEQIPLANGLSVNAIHLRFGRLEAIIGHAAASLTTVGTGCPAS
jgi:hypothetical protein